MDHFVIFRITTMDYEKSLGIQDSGLSFQVISLPEPYNSLSHLIPILWTHLWKLETSTDFMNKIARFSKDLVYRIYTHPPRQSESGRMWRRKGSKIGF